MVKADLTRDYYGDLELQPGADTADIKKQFKKLALTYHPDRNPGRESEVTAKFQRIQSAHEVLTDAQERAKYDNNRSRTSTKFGNSYAGSSGVRGNPWSDISSQYPPPPKPPTARRPPQQPSAGAERYKKWEAPKQSAYQAAHEGAGARQRTYEAWESMKTKPQTKPQTTQPGPGRTWKAPQPPPRGTPQSGQQESNARAHAPPPKPRPGYDEFRQETTPGSPHRRSHSSNASNRKGFMPNTPGGDEPAAPMGAYFTQRNKPTVAPDLPAREPPQREPPPRQPPPSTHNVGADPLKQFREPVRPPMEPRMSTPYATHGGEKLNPFESSNLHRSRSTREPSQRYDAEGHVPRTGSSPNLASPHRSKSFVDRGPSRPRHHAVPSVEIDSDSSEDGPEISGRSFGKPRSRAKATNGASPSQGTHQTPDPSSRQEPQRKPSKISQFRQWYKENPDQEPPLNGFPADGPPLRSSQAKSQPNGEPSMYAYSAPPPSETKRASNYSVKLPTVSEIITSSNERCSSYSNRYDLASMKHPHLFPNGTLSVAPPSGATEDPVSLTPFEGLQRTLVDHLLLNKRQASSSSIPRSTARVDSHNSNQNQRHNGNPTASPDNFTTYRDSAETGSPSKKFRSRHLRSFHSYDPTQSRAFWSDMEKFKAGTNHIERDRFSFNVNDDTFKPSSPGPRPKGFSNSAENISTKFSTKDWDGKFEAGADFFKPEQKASRVPPRSRAQSGSRSRGRSPTKPRTIDPHYMQQRDSEPEPAVESPGGTKFSAKEWADTFKPQTFAPPPTPIPPRQVPSRKRTGPTVRPTMGGNAAVVDDGETSDEKPLFIGRKPPPTPTVPSPDAMDVDTPPATNTVPHFEANSSEKLNINTTSPKRAAAPSSSPTDEAALKVNFDDLKIQDLLSSLEMPRPPMPPTPPEASQNLRPTQAAYEDYQLRFAKYMTAWDLYNSQFMLHLVARKNQNDALGAKRWLDEKGLEIYRRGLKEDGIVLSRWAGEKERHEGAVREWVVLKEKMKESAGGEARPRKKTH